MVIRSLSSPVILREPFVILRPLPAVILREHFAFPVILSEAKNLAQGKLRVVILVVGKT